MLLPTLTVKFTLLVVGCNDVAKAYYIINGCLFACSIMDRAVLCCAVQRGVVLHASVHKPSNCEPPADT